MKVPRNVLNVEEQRGHELYVLSSQDTDPVLILYWVIKISGKNKFMSNRRTEDLSCIEAIPVIKCSNNIPLSNLKYYFGIEYHHKVFNSTQQKYV